MTIIISKFAFLGVSFSLALVCMCACKTTFVSAPHNAEQSWKPCLSMDHCAGHLICCIVAREIIKTQLGTETEKFPSSHIRLWASGQLSDPEVAGIWVLLLY